MKNTEELNSLVYPLLKYTWGNLHSFLNPGSDGRDIFKSISEQKWLLPYLNDFPETPWTEILVIKPIVMESTCQTRLHLWRLLQTPSFPQIHFLYLILFMRTLSRSKIYGWSWSRHGKYFVRSHLTVGTENTLEQVIIVLLIPRHSISLADISSACSFLHRQIYWALLLPLVLPSCSSSQSIHFTLMCKLLFI